MRKRAVDAGGDASHAAGVNLFGDLPASGHVVVVIPTYNERDNLGRVLDRLFAAVPEVDALVVDDDSPDGTGRLADERARRDERVHVLHRTAKEGLGAAYLAGFDWALRRGYDVLVEMDADGSHAPEQLPRLLRALAHADLAIGSRYVPGGAVVHWPRRRKLLSRGANLYAQLLLGARIRDMTAGFRAYRAEALRQLGLADVSSEGYCFQVDLTWRAVRAGLRVGEIPITFTERAAGSSKMDGSVIREAVVSIAGWGLAHRTRQLRRLFHRT